MLYLQKDKWLTFYYEYLLYTVSCCLDFSYTTSPPCKTLPTWAFKLIFLLILRHGPKNHFFNLVFITALTCTGKTFLP